MTCTETFKNGELVTYEPCFGSDVVLKFIGMAEDLKHANDCVLLYEGMPVPARCCDVKKVKREIKP
jgi:hypothetical protein